MRKDVKQTKDSIKFTVGKGKAKAAVESLRAQFRDAGWKEDVASTEQHGRHTLFSKEGGRSVTITTPTRVSCRPRSACRLFARRLEAAK